MNRTDKVIALITGQETVGGLLNAGYGATTNDWKAVQVLNEAEEAGTKAGTASKPIPMLVQQHKNMADDNSPVAKQWVVEGGVCGFAWVNVSLKNEASRKFISELKKAGLADPKKDGGMSSAPFQRDSYYKGYSYWVGFGGQSMTRKEAFAHAFAVVLQKYDIMAHSMSRMD